MKKILITGSNGLLGQKLVKQLKDHTGFDLIATSRGKNRISDQLGYTYEAGALISNNTDIRIQQSVNQYQPSVNIGVRFPHFWINRQEKKYSSHDWLEANQFTLLLNQEGQHWWNQKKDQLDQSHSKLIKVVNVAEELEIQSDTSSEPSFYPYKEIPMLLVRPDGQIAWRTHHIDHNMEHIFSHLLSA